MSLVQGHTPSRRMAKQSQIRKQILEAWSKWKGQEVSSLPTGALPRPHGTLPRLPSGTQEVLLGKSS